MKATLVLIVAALGFVASVAWAGESAAPAATKAGPPAVRVSPAGTPAARKQPHQTHRPLVGPALETGAISAPSVLCACVRDRHSA